MNKTNSEKQINLSLPIITVSESNLRQHWSIAHKRHKNQQKAVYYALLPFRDKIHLPCTITITRLAPRLLDSDNLQASLKWIRDQIADTLLPGQAKGRADGDPRITWHYEQQKQPKNYGVSIQITFLESQESD